MYIRDPIPVLFSNLYCIQFEKRASLSLLTSPGAGRNSRPTVSITVPSPTWGGLGGVDLGFHLDLNIVTVTLPFIATCCAPIGQTHS